MNFKRLFAAVAACAAMIAGGLLTYPSMAKDSATFDSKQTEAIQGIIKDYLMKNPEVLRDAITELNRRQEAVAEAAAKEGRKTVLPSLYKSETPYSTGKGKITLVEFFDYNCGYCRHAFNKMIKLMDTEKDLRIVFVEMPILSEESKLASQAAIAAAKQGKYFEFHRAMMTTPGVSKLEKIFSVAKDVGINVEKLKADMALPEVEQQIEKNIQLANALGINGTPAFFIGDEAIPGAPENLGQILKTAIDQVREKGCSVC